MKPIESVIPLLDKSKSIVITTHANPDADALGSSLALYHFLKGRQLNVEVISPTDYPDFLNWMPGNESVICTNRENQHQIIEKISKADIIFCLDFSGLKRVKSLEHPLAQTSAVKVIIDHHLDPEDFAEFALWDIKAAATAELIYDFILMSKGSDEITPDIANCIYAGINTDTGSFKHPSTTSKVHRIVAELIDKGANVNAVSRHIYDTNSLERLRFIGFALLEKLTVVSELNIAYFVISIKDFERFGLKIGDTEGLVNYALSIKGIVMAAIIIERPDEVKLSFRSIGNYVVNTFAAQYFNGGGHKYASGGASNDTLENTTKQFQELIKHFKKDFYQLTK